MSHPGHSGGLLPQSSEDWSIMSRLAVASITSQGTMGGLLVGGFVWTVGAFYFPDKDLIFLFISSYWKRSDGGWFSPPESFTAVCTFTRGWPGRTKRKKEPSRNSTLIMPPGNCDWSSIWHPPIAATKFNSKETWPIRNRIQKLPSHHLLC